MSVRRLLPFLMLALLLAPFGRVAAAELQSAPHHQVMQAASHCPDQPQPGGGSDRGKMAIDCMIACAAMAPAADPFVIPPLSALGLPASAATSTYVGIRPEADPPPPRLA